MRTCSHLAHLPEDSICMAIQDEGNTSVYSAMYFKSHQGNEHNTACTV
jgi:hypothetical protein